MRKSKYMNKIYKKELDLNGFCQIQNGVFLCEEENGYVLKNNNKDILFKFESLDHACHVLFGNT